MREGMRDGMRGDGEVDDKDMAPKEKTAAKKKSAPKKRKPTHRGGSHDTVKIEDIEEEEAALSSTPQSNPNPITN